MKKFIDSDILGSIKANLEVGNITLDDYNQLLELLNKLYQQIVLQYQRKGGDKEMKPLLPGAKLEAENAMLADEKAVLSEKNATLAGENAALADKNAVLEDRNAALENEMEILRRKLHEIENGRRGQ